MDVVLKDEGRWEYFYNKILNLNVELIEDYDGSWLIYEVR